ncbi:unnamed protein product [Ceratitis capitata]|uniref:(Mediterranean fruit fly) hypothetical protein n=1 Tax=Ceratitis capitata TaxID=7213 RepID=A0A811UX17_CERCA|nr:unnamed protein product [Ceratitis capitata]
MESLVEVQDSRSMQVLLQSLSAQIHELKSVISRLNSEKATLQKENDFLKRNSSQRNSDTTPKIPNDAEMEQFDHGEVNFPSLPNVLRETYSADPHTQPTTKQINYAISTKEKSKLKDNHLHLYVTTEIKKR